MRVLVTGAAGFIGSHVTRQIVQEGHAVWAVVSPRGSTERIDDIKAQLSLAPTDLRDHSSVRDLVASARPDCAIHLAWYAAPGLYWTAPENLDCVAMTLNLAQHLADARCTRLVAAGTCAEYDWSYGFLSEEVTPLNPRTLYGACKNATREMLERFCKQAAMSFAWTRFFYLYGPEEARDRLVPSVISALLGGQSAKCTGGIQFRDYLHVQDAASALWAVAKSGFSGAVNIGSGQPVTIRAMVETIAELLDRKRNVEFGALPADPQDPLLLVADVRRLKSQTGWEPAWSLEEGLRRTVAWWRQKNENSKDYYGQTIESVGGSS